MMGHGMRLDDYIAQLKVLRDLYGNVECWTQAGDYPEGATGPTYVAKDDGYTPSDTVVLR